MNPKLNSTPCEPTLWTVVRSRFADPESDRFEGIGFSRGGNGIAILNDVLGYVQCRVVARHPTGDHDIIIGEVEEAMADEGRPLLYYRGGYAQLER